ncbi:MAG: Minf_1886 family protein [Planctomycetota bacterium]|nr:Minf_1886 family protein [Planctomycetota bacterium]
MEGEPKKNMGQVIQEDGRYPVEAFGFLHEALNRAAKTIYGDDAPTGGRRHVTGQQLCHSLRELAVERWGMLAPTVLSKWNVNATIDFGNMVYLLIENDLMKKADEDSIEDFRDVYDFDEAFAVEEDFEVTE